MEAAGISSPAVAGGKVFIGSDQTNKIYCFDAITGDKVWTYKTGGSVYSSPAIADGNVYVGSYDGKMYAFGTRIYMYPVEVDGITYHIAINTNSITSSFSFDQLSNKISFNITGEQRTTGFLNVTFHKVFLGEPYHVLKDGSPITPTMASNATHIFLYLNYTQSTSKIEIIGTTVIARELYFAPGASLYPPTAYSGGTQTIRIGVLSGGLGVTNVTFTLNSSMGETFSAVTDQNNGTYTATYTGPDTTTQIVDGIGVAVSRTNYTPNSEIIQNTIKPLELNITFTDQNGNRIPGVSIVSTSQPTGQSALSKMTDANGLASFTGVLKGSYTLKATKTGYEDKTWSITIPEGQATINSATLTKSPEFPTVYILGAVAIIAVIAAVIFLMKRRSARYQKPLFTFKYLNIPFMKTKTSHSIID